MAWLRAAALGTDLADALAYAHAAGVIHTRLKPSKVLLAGDRGVLTDFVVPRAFEARAKANGGSGRVLENSPYLAPEIYQGKPVQAPAGMWALGAALYAAVKGWPPFGPGPAMVYRLIYEPLPAPGHAGPMASDRRRTL